ncbi:hypothetical protein Nepgr_007290 [Nepenthes gracilis]|uniref:Uncharacterized protein n=1 Tax=Nepenthes gracilis TaxID=150966 RepID=A0AAD3S6Y0_NEPGR|nr:hypothetical protein Nepgr_007290 [Nepenthes gracilis]
MILLRLFECRRRQRLVAVLLLGLIRVAAAVAAAAAAAAAVAVEGRQETLGASFLDVSVGFPSIGLFLLG